MVDVLFLLYWRSEPENRLKYTVAHHEVLLLFANHSRMLYTYIYICTCTKKTLDFLSTDDKSQPFITITLYSRLIRNYIISTSFTKVVVFTTKRIKNEASKSPYTNTQFQAQTFAYPSLFIEGWFDLFIEPFISTEPISRGCSSHFRRFFQYQCTHKRKTSFPICGEICLLWFWILPSCFSTYMLEVLRVKL